MRRRLATLLSAALVASGVAILTPAQPAAATGVCVQASGSVHMAASLRYTVTVTTPAYIDVNGAVTTAFSAGFSVGACINTTGTTTTVKTLSATGTISGWCNLSSGSGVTADGHRFAWLGVGTTLVFTGDLVGMASITPNALVGQSCNTGASAFLASGIFVKHHCLVKSKGLTTVDLPETWTLPLPFFHIYTRDWHFWTKICVPGVIL